MMRILFDREQVGKQMTDCRGRGNRGSRGPTVASTTKQIVPSDATTRSLVPPPTSGGRDISVGRTSSTVRVAFGKSVAYEETTTTRGALRGRGSMGIARGKTVYRRREALVGVGITQPEPVHVPSEAMNPILTTGRGGGVLMRGRGAFSSTAGRGNNLRFMQWFGTPEQWANDEN